MSVIGSGRGDNGGSETTPRHHIIPPFPLSMAHLKFQRRLCLQYTYICIVTRLPNTLLEPALFAARILARCNMSTRPATQSLTALRRLAHSAAAASSSSSASSSRVSLPPTPPPASAARVYTPRKTFLYNYYDHLLHRSQLVLLFSHANLSVSTLLKIRRAIAAIKPSPAPFSPSPLTGVTGEGGAAQPFPAPEEKAQLTILRTGILSALTRSQPEDSSLRPYLSGPTALITCPSLSPAYLSKLLSAINRSVSSSQKDVPANGPAPKQPEMKLVAGILEGGRLVGGKEIERVKELPELDILRAQVVGMLEGQGRSLVGLLSQAGGGGLVRTLQGLEKGMQEEGSASG